MPVRVVYGIVCEPHEATAHVPCPVCQGDTPGQKALFKSGGCVTCAGKGLIPIRSVAVTGIERAPADESSTGDGGSGGNT